MSNTLVGHSYALFTIYLSGEPGFGYTAFG